MNTNLLHFFLNYARLYKIMGLKILWHYLPLTHYFSDGCHTILDSYLIHPFKHFWSRLPGGSGVKGSACNAGDLGSISGSGRSPGEGNGNPLQYSCLENPMDRGSWWAAVHGVTRSWTRLSDFTSLWSKLFVYLLISNTVSAHLTSLHFSWVGKKTTKDHYSGVSRKEKDKERHIKFSSR